MDKKSVTTLAIVLVIVGALAYPIGGAIAAIMKAEIVNRVSVQESGAKVFKVFDQEIGSGERFGPSLNLKGFKTARVSVYQTVNGSGGGAPVENNYSCGGAPANKLGVDITWGKGIEAGVTAGNNNLEINEPPNLSARPDIYSAEVPVLRPKLNFDICNHTTNVERVAIYVYAFRN